MPSPRPATGKPNFDTVLKNCKRSAVKLSKETPLLLNFMDLRFFFFSEKTHFHFQLNPDPMEFKFSVNFSISKVQFPLKTCDKNLNLIYFKNHCLSFSVKQKVNTKTHCQCRGAVFVKRFYFFLLRNNHFWSFHAFSRN